MSTVMVEPVVATIVAAGDISPEGRETVRCKHHNCNLLQFRTVSGLCRRCHEPLSSPSPVPVEPPLSWEERCALQVRLTKLTCKETHDWLVVGVPRATRELRRIRHLSQRRLAKFLGVPRTYISKIENAHAFPKLRSLGRLAAGLEVNLFDFISLAAAPPSEFVRVLENILLPEKILWYFRQIASPEDQVFFREFTESLCLRRAEESRAN